MSTKAENKPSGHFALQDTQTGHYWIRELKRFAPLGTMTTLSNETGHEISRSLLRTGDYTENMTHARVRQLTIGETLQCTPTPAMWIPTWAKTHWVNYFQQQLERLEK